jgi:hypothetical protein
MSFLSHSCRCIQLVAIVTRAVVSEKASFLCGFFSSARKSPVSFLNYNNPALVYPRYHFISHQTVLFWQMGKSPPTKQTEVTCHMNEPQRAPKLLVCILPAACTNWTIIKCLAMTVFSLKDICICPLLLMYYCIANNIDVKQNTDTGKIQNNNLNL